MKMPVDHTQTDDDHEVVEDEEDQHMGGVHPMVLNGGFAIDLLFLYHTPIIGQKQ